MNGDHHPPGVIALPVGEQARYSKFTADLLNLDRPDGSIVNFATGMDVTLGVNTVIAQMMDPENEKYNYDWLWIMGDDHTFPRDTLRKLLGRLYKGGISGASQLQRVARYDPDVDIVVPLVLRRYPPFNLVIYDQEHWEDVDGISMPHYRPFKIEDLPEKGLIEVVAAGTAGMLVRRSVLENIPTPWFESSSGAYINDDLWFCNKVREAGYKIYADVEVALGHISQHVLVPTQREGRWGVTLDFGGQNKNVIWLGGSPEEIAKEQARQMAEAGVA